MNNVKSSEIFSIENGSKYLTILHLVVTSLTISDAIHLRILVMQLLYFQKQVIPERQQLSRIVIHLLTDTKTSYAFKIFITSWGVRNFKLITYRIYKGPSELITETEMLTHVYNLRHTLIKNIHEFDKKVILVPPSVSFKQNPYTIWNRLPSNKTVVLNNEGHLIYLLQLDDFNKQRFITFKHWLKFILDEKIHIRISNLYSFPDFSNLTENEHHLIDPYFWKRRLNINQSNKKVNNQTNSKNKCSIFTKIAEKSYTTHLYYFERNEFIYPETKLDFNENRRRFLDAILECSTKKSCDQLSKPLLKLSFKITMVTVFTADRFSIFERLVSQWHSRLTAVFYGSVSEILALPNIIRNSTVLMGDAGKYVTFHVVYRDTCGHLENVTEEYIPINYLRNIGLNETSTPYVFYNDVDLIPIPNLPQILEKHLIREAKKLDLLHLRRQALVVPALEAMTILDEWFPNNKFEASWMMEHFLPTITGYKDLHGWKAGHRPTDYKKWQSATKPYEVSYRDRWEPYVVLATTSAPLYNLKFVERVYDKVHYALGLQTKGFNFLVLHNAFISEYMTYFIILSENLDVYGFSVERVKLIQSKYNHLLRAHFVTDMKIVN